MIKTLGILIILLVGFLTDNLVFSCALVAAWLLFHHFLSRFFLWAILIGGVAIWSGYQALVQGKDLPETVTWNVITLVFIGIVFKLAFGRR